jgi:hypothetical protein
MLVQILTDPILLRFGARATTRQRRPAFIPSLGGSVGINGYFLTDPPRDDRRGGSGVIKCVYRRVRTGVT